VSVSISTREFHTDEKECNVVFLKRNKAKNWHWQSKKKEKKNEKHYLSFHLCFCEPVVQRKGEFPFDKLINCPVLSPESYSCVLRDDKQQTLV
jgi:hypothetical protein